ncbi:hypothetical protein PQR46_01515 [Paraburkholderia sediminicola]
MQPVYGLMVSDALGRSDPVQPFSRVRGEAMCSVAGERVFEVPA